MRKLAVAVKTALTLILLGACLSGAFLAHWWFVPPSQPTTMTIKVDEGESLREVANRLAEAGVIRQPTLFRLYARFIGASTSIRVGTYEFQAPVLPAAVLDKLVRGQVQLTEFSHPPGWNMWQVADRLSSVFPNIKRESWLEAFRDPAYLKQVAPGAKTLEGFLFPDVYRIRPKPTVNEVMQMFLKNFEKNFTSDIVASGKKLGLNPLQILTLASIIEKETAVPQERSLISAVFHSRLSRGMRLQTDPTVIYGIWNRFDGNLRRSDLETYTPFNTYLISGLPPGPIANPGREAMLAAVNPEKTSYLYFVARGDGTHQFSKTLEEHNAAVKNFQILPSRKNHRRL